MSWRNPFCISTIDIGISRFLGLMLFSANKEKARKNLCNSIHRVLSLTKVQAASVKATRHGVVAGFVLRR